MKTITIAALTLLLSSAMVAIPQWPQSNAVRVTTRYPIIESKTDVRPQSYEKNCRFFYWSAIFGKGSEMVGFHFVRNGKTENPVKFVKIFSVMIDEATTSPTMEEINPDEGLRYVLRMSQHDYDAEQLCLSGILIEPKK
jgi:hypothetical protein